MKLLTDALTLIERDGGNIDMFYHTEIYKQYETQCH